LRLEKGHIILGRDTDALTNPYEANLDWVIRMDKPFFIGQRSLRIISTRPRQRQLAGFTLEQDYAGPFPEECCLVITGDGIDGRVTSIGRSPFLDRIIGLAYVRPGQAPPGTRITIRRQDGALVPATITATPFRVANEGRA
jgi:sarcosine oxidase subunit alpha